jgi:prepilin-type N-terminal cleavage/methylation domain-containing protein
MFLTSRRAFTLIELLVTISIIVIIISVMTLALNSARTSSQVAETTSRLSAMKQATIRFKEDIGYLPAVLGTGRELLSLPAFPPASAYVYRRTMQNWYSITSPTDFLLGYGNRDQDGYGRLPGSVPNDADFNEVPRLGIRHPSLDGVWRATDSYANNGTWDLDSRLPSTRGRLYGPYLEIENDQMVGRLGFASDGVTPLTDPITNQVKVFYPNDPLYNTANPLVIVDTWGVPIRYYRTLYPVLQDQSVPQNTISRSYPPSPNYDRPTMSDFIVLRPFTFESGKATDGTMSDQMNGANTDGDTSTTFELQTGQFAYFSSGPDQQSNDYIRADLLDLTGNTQQTDETNVDNIVEVGP